MARCLRLLLIAVVTLALAAGGMVVGPGATAVAAPTGGSIVIADHGACPTCQAAPVMTATSHHCAASCPSLIGTLPDALVFEGGARPRPVPAPDTIAAGRGTSPDPIPPRS